MHVLTQIWVACLSIGASLVIRGVSEVAANLLKRPGPRDIAFHLLAGAISVGGTVALAPALLAPSLLVLGVFRVHGGAADRVVFGRVLLTWGPMLLAAYFYHRPLAPLALWSPLEFAYMAYGAACYCAGSAATYALAYLGLALATNFYRQVCAHSTAMGFRTGQIGIERLDRLDRPGGLADEWRRCAAACAVRLGAAFSLRLPRGAQDGRRTTQRRPRRWRRRRHHRAGRSM